MKPLKMLFTILLAGVSYIGIAQTQPSQDSKKDQATYQSRTYKKTMRLTKKDSIKTKENAPILNDNGTSSTTGTIDGRSSTGRPGADTMVNYTVKRKKTTIKTVDGTQSPESVKSRKK